jgi:phospholipid/cholesterol/gamma-HCH transport system substrate-binding protein
MDRKILVGMLLLGALVIFALSTFYVENWQFYIGKGYRLTARFPRADTLDEGDLVRMAGVQVGKVDRLEIQTERADEIDPVVATLWIREGITVHSDDKAVIRMSSVFGGNYVEIERGDPQSPVLVAGQEILNTGVTPSITEVIEQSKDTLNEMQLSFEELNTIAADLKEGKSALGRLLGDAEMGEKMHDLFVDGAEAAESLRAATSKVDRGEGVLGKLLVDEEMAENLDKFTADLTAMAENLRMMATDLQEGEGTAGKLLKDEALYDELKDSISVFADAAEKFAGGEGLLPLLLSDKEMAEDFQQLTANMSDLTAKLSEGEGTFGKLLTSDEAYERLVGGLDGLQESMNAIADGDGTVGKLINEDEVYEQLKLLLTDVQGIVDNYREQSPIVSFTGAIFGAF